MRAFLVYNAARLLLFVVALGVLDLVGARGLMLFALALIVSGIASYVLLSGLRDRLSESVAQRVNRTGTRAATLKQRIEEGARAEDVPAESAAPAADDADARSTEAAPSHVS
jgi:hypothetical protein